MQRYTIDNNQRTSDATRPTEYRSLLRPGELSVLLNTAFVPNLLHAEGGSISVNNRSVDSSSLPPVIGTRRKIISYSR